MDCVSFYNHISTNRSKVTSALEQAVLERGRLVVNAVSAVIEAVTPGNNPAAHNMAGAIICGFKTIGSKAAIGNLRGLCMNAMYRSRDLEEDAMGFSTGNLLQWKSRQVIWQCSEILIRGQNKACSGGYNCRNVSLHSSEYQWAGSRVRIKHVWCWMR